MAEYNNGEQPEPQVSLPEQVIIVIIMAFLLIILPGVEIFNIYLGDPMATIITSVVMVNVVVIYSTFRMGCIIQRGASRKNWCPSPGYWRSIWSPFYMFYVAMIWIVYQVFIVPKMVASETIANISIWGTLVAAVACGVMCCCSGSALAKYYRVEDPEIQRLIYA